MKLIIEIPEGLYFRAKWNQYAMGDSSITREIIANGTPLDDIKAEIASEKTGLSEDSDKDYWLNSCLEIIDSHISGKDGE